MAQFMGGHRFLAVPGAPFAHVPLTYPDGLSNRCCKLKVVRLQYGVDSSNSKKTIIPWINYMGFMGIKYGPHAIVMLVDGR
jgi:hypothetical protein